MEMYGSLINRLMESSQPIKPVVGMGCTELMWSDREPYEVIAVDDDRHCIARRMRAIHKGGAYENDWDLESDENGSVVNLFLTNKGVWVERYKDRSYGCKFRMGVAEKYFDYEF